ncbi:hypothetical protein HQ520_06795 [bacterium]|nr:hypothetical protein [bacterium]
MRETELYPPLKRFLESQGYAVKGEIGDCDVVAVRGDEEPVLVEIKTRLNLQVLLQAVERLGASDKVYVAVPPDCSTLRTRRRTVVRLLRRLGLGLLVVCPEGPVDAVLDPGDYQPRKRKAHTDRLLAEFSKRVGDPNLGGSDRRKGLLTAYRQRALRIANLLKEQGATKASEIAATLEDPKARNVLYRDVYGWFERQGAGIYALSPKGEKEIPLWETTP